MTAVRANEVNEGLGRAAPRAPRMPTTRVLVATIGAKPEAIAQTCVERFELDAGELRRQLGIESVRERLTSLGEIAGAIERHRPDVALLLPTWRDKAEDVIAAFAALHARPDRPRLVYFDWYAPTSSPHFGVLPYVDRYLKRSVLVDFAEYRKPYEAGYGVADFVARLLSLDLRGWRFGSELPNGHEHKLWMGWNFGVGESYERLLRYARIGGRVPLVSGPSLLPAWERRSIDVNRRLGAPTTTAAPEKADWYQRYRDESAKSVERLGARFHCSGVTRIPRKQYLLELLRSKVVFSPFGWGEICFRDYEAVACGCLLVKPSMEHVATSPDIYVPNETYVPVRWDLSDAADVIAACLADPARSAMIARRGQEALGAYFARQGFVHDVERSLRGLLRGQRDVTQ